ncbi:MAG: FAD-binding domain-containing protein, partial [Shinella sp.]
LEELDSAWIHKPFDAPENALSEGGVDLGKTYPKPIVDHRKARERALAAYKSLKND